MQPASTSIDLFEEADALLVIDMQNSFLHPEGAMRAHRGRSLINVESTIDHNVEAVELATARGLPVIFTRHAYRPGYVDAGPRTMRLVESMGVSPLIAGSWDAEVVDQLAGTPDAILVDKARMDAFHGTNLDVVLRGIGASLVLMTGIVTNACVETTARSAAMRDLEVTILSDCCTTYSPEQQAHALEALEFFMFAQVVGLDSLVGSSR